MKIFSIKQTGDWIWQADGAKSKKIFFTSFTIHNLKAIFVFFSDPHPFHWRYEHFTWHSVHNQQPSTRHRYFRCYEINGEYIKNSEDYIYLDTQFLWIVKILADIFDRMNVSLCVCTRCNKMKIKSQKCHQYTFKKMKTHTHTYTD